MINEITCYTFSNRVTSRFFNAINLNAKPDVMQIYDWDRHSINKKKGVHKRETFLVFRHKDRISVGVRLENIASQRGI